MKWHRYSTCLVLLLATLTMVPCLGLAKPQMDLQAAHEETQKSAQQRRKEARQRLERMQRELQPGQKTQSEPLIPMVVQTQPPQGINQAVDITKPNWSYSPNLRKFMDSLPGLTAAGANNLGQYIPIAVPDQAAYPGSDYYEIGLVEYREQMHSDLPAVVGNKLDPGATGGTKLRGYVQLNGGDPVPHYLGPTIVAKRDRPVRVKFVNMLPTGSGGNLFIPVDTSIMGSGMFHTMDAGGNMMMGMFSQNRGTLHLHGGLSPWISDGTPHQWVAPAGEMTMYPKGVATTNVPDMPDPGPGAMNFYWTNGQSARLMFYHDHAYGITRLNVYVGEAAGFVLTDQAEDGLIDGGVLPDLGGPYRYGIPLIIQDKSFVNKGTPIPGFPAGYTATKPTSEVDPLWDVHIPSSSQGDLWFPHEYLPNENLFDGTGFWPMGRWDYGPWILPPMFPMNDTLPSPSHVPEAFLDTMTVNGTAYPYIELPNTVVRFRILNACNDRMLNLQLYEADPDSFMVDDGAGGLWGTEVRMVDAAPRTDQFQMWPKDGRDGGVPDPTLMGPDWLQIGNEGGLLKELAVIPPQAIDYDYDRTSATFGSVSSVSLFLPPAVRADVVVDLRDYNEGDTLILYNDAPAPIPLYDARYDIFTDDPGDRLYKGGVPRVPPGYGPNTRTVMQIRIKGTAPAPASFDTLATALPQAFAAGQDPHPVPAGVYAAIADETLNISGQAKPIQRIMTELPGIGYRTPPVVNLYGPPGTVITPGRAVATLNGVSGVVLTNGGTGYTSPPQVVFTGGGGTGAAAQAIVSGGVVTAIVMTELGSNYTTSPLVSFNGGGGNGAAALANVTLGTVGSIIVQNPGLYTKAPYVFLSGGGGNGANAIAMLQGDMVLDGKAIVEGMDMEYGRMNAVLGSIPNVLTPTVGAGPVVGMAFYIDPPTEILNPDELRLWRLNHIGVDSHSLHFHLFEVQVINRVDWTNTIKPPYPEEIGWKETIRTNPFEDIIFALRPKVSAMRLPFGVPNSMRLLDPTMPMDSIGHFSPVAPPMGVPAVAQITNVMTDFGWEYVWHCHLLGHEENDMMRPIVFRVPSTRPAAFSMGVATGTQTECTFNWADATPFDYNTWSPVSTLGNPANEIGFRIERAVGQTSTNFTQIGTALANWTSYSDTNVTPGQYYRYRVVAFNAAGTRTSSNVLTVRAGSPPPNAPSSLAASVLTGPQVRLQWTDRATNETGFEIERNVNGTGFSLLATVGPRLNTGTTSYTDTNVAIGNTYSYRVRALASVGAPSGYSNTATATVADGPAAPSGLTASAALVSFYTATVTLRWTDNSNNETGFTVQRATNSAFTGALNYSVAANTMLFRQSVSRRSTFYYRIRANNAAGSSAWSTPAMISVP